MRSSLNLTDYLLHSVKLTLEIDLMSCYIESYALGFHHCYSALNYQWPVLGKWGVGFLN